MLNQKKYSTLINQYKKLNIENLNKELDDLYSKMDKKIVVLDDDPTGIQTVHDVNVYTDWSEDSLESGFREDNNMFFILTNSRGMTDEESRICHLEIAKNLEIVSKKENKDYILISRSDSILRGHYPMETEVLKSEIEKASDKIYDGEIICPFFEEGGRYTIDDVHYVKYDDSLIPAGETEFAKDKTFGYKASNLGEWVEEKTKGEFRKDDLIYISLNDLRDKNISTIKEKLINAKDFNKIIVNAISYDDIKVFVLSLMESILEGKRFMIRSAASIVKIIGNIDDKAYLTTKDLLSNGNGGLVVVGSYTNKTTEQLKEVEKLEKINMVEFNSDLVVDDLKFEEEIQRVIKLIDNGIANGKNIVVYTKREPLQLDTNDKNEILEISVKISQGLTSIVKKTSIKPSFILAKGGITSSDVGTIALGVKRANVLGQVKPGIPVWITDKDSKFGEIPYIIFPGNVGDKNTLKEILELLIKEGD